MSASVSELTSDALYIINFKFLAVEKVLAKSSEGFELIAVELLLTPNIVSIHHCASTLFYS